MATYRPSFVDVSGLSSGITKGLMVAAEMKRKQDALAEAKSDDFLKTYQPGKLRQMDIPDFTNAYTNYKQSALLYSRLNRGGAKPEQLSAAKAAMDKSLGDLNDIYSRSTSAAEKQAEYVGYLKTAREKGYAIPNEVSAFTNALSSTPISKLDVGTIPSAYTFELVPKDIEWGKLKENLEAGGARLTEVDKVREEYAYATGIDGKPMKADRVITYKGRNPNTTVDLLSKFSLSDARLANAAKLDYELLSQGMKNGSDESIKRFREIQQYFPQVQTLEDVNPMMVFGLNLYRKEREKEEIDYEPSKAQYRAQVDRRNLSMRQRGLDIQQARASKEGEEEVDFIDTYTNIKNLLSSSSQPTGAPVNRLNTTDQMAVVDVAKSVTGQNLGAQDLYMRNKNGVPTLYSNKDILDMNGVVKISANERIGEIGSTGVNVAATTGAKQKGAAQKAGSKGRYKGTDIYGNPIYE